MTDNTIPDKINALNLEFKDATAHEILYYFLNEYKGEIAFATSLGAEDQILTEIITSIDKNTKIFSLDTGRMFQETYDLIEKTNNKYKINIDVYFPDTNQVEEMTREKGINLFYESIENRKLCCNIRKIEPLKRALKGFKVWVSGLRNEQSVTRKELKIIEWDSNYQMIKVNPLINWTEKQVWKYIRENQIPFNTLHDKGFPSIGCQPCTRAIKHGEDIRAGRWWWENPEMKECGIHIN